MKFNDEDEKENIKRTEEIVKTVAFFVVIIPVIFIVLIITVSSIFTSSNIKYMEKFYILDVNNENKSIIINLIEQEKENISSNSKLYCDSLYRIEYYNINICKIASNLTLNLMLLIILSISSFIYFNIDNIKNDNY